ncbi:MAG TPA: glutamate--tRNA ligase [Dissulfurispiraceae bacterium]|nr:glutamate--tRNA ligase [Dissulfurispiraceae bacterium]
MTTPVRVRFAPSPTGYLHIGGARTALFNWLFARRNNGVFILRIEDTDRTRSTDEYILAIMDGMTWLKLDWEEGPYRQTDRFDTYRSFAERLIQEGKAYYCTCSPEELEERRQQALALGKSPMYAGRCRELLLKPAAPAAVRFRMPREGQTVVQDMIKGPIVFDNSVLEDMVILRSDGTPTYNFVVVVDDIDMKITHVIRGDDHVNNTPKQIHIYKAFGWEVPQCAHLPMILGADKTRLSKRHGATSVTAYRDMGYLPDALVNYLVRLGWSFGDQEIFTRDELIQHFSLENIGESAAVFNPEKLLWLNGQYIINSSPESLAEAVLPYLKRDGTVAEDAQADMAWLGKAAYSLRERSKTLVEMATQMKYYIADEIAIDPKAQEKHLKSESLQLLAEIRILIEEAPDVSAAAIESLVHAMATTKGMKLGALAQPLRVALTGGTASPGIFEVIEIMGKELVMKRLAKVIGG